MKYREFKDRKFVFSDTLGTDKNTSLFDDTGKEIFINDVLVATKRLSPITSSLMEFRVNEFGGEFGCGDESCFLSFKKMKDMGHKVLVKGDVYQDKGKSTFLK